MKVGFIGAGGTGKTTLAKALAERIGIEYIPSPSRSCFEKMGIKTEDDQKNMSPAQRFTLQMSIFNAIDSQVTSTSTGVFDRTHLDNFAYDCLQCHNEMPNEIFSAMDKITYEGLRTFDFLFYAPIYDWPDVNDGMRTNSLAARMIISSFTWRYLDYHGFKYWILPNELVENRVQYCMRRFK